MRILCTFVLLLGSIAAHASDALIEFSESMYSFSAEFTQTVYDSDSTILQESAGQVQLMRPGKFRWTYDEPIKQVIVADGLTLWVYDEDIAQVTMQPQAATLGSAPIGLLSGQRAIDSEFNVIDLGEKDDLHWFQLEPLVTDTDFNEVYIALDDNGLRAMELRDNFEQATQIRFSNFKKNAKIAAQEFVFTPPEGADVIGEAGSAAMESSAEPTLQPQLSVEETPLDAAPAPLADPVITTAPPNQPVINEQLTTDDLLAPVSPSPVPPSATAAPATAEDVLLTQPVDPVQETPDEAPGMAELLEVEDVEPETTDSEITLEVIETTIVPAE